MDRTWLRCVRRTAAVLAAALVLCGATTGCDATYDPDGDPGVEDAGNPADADDSLDADVPVGADAPDVREATARVKFVHESPDSRLENLDILLDGEPLVEDFEFRTATGYLEVDAGRSDIALAAPGGDPDEALAVFEQVEFHPGEPALVVVSGVLESDRFPALEDGRNTEIALHVLEQALKDSEDIAGHRVVGFHAAPDAPGLATIAGNEVLAFEGLEYGEFTDGYLLFPTATSVLDLFDNITTERIASYQTPHLDGDGASVVVASGLLDAEPGEKPPFELVEYSAPADSEKRVDGHPLEEAARMQFVNNSVDSVVDPVDLYAEGNLVAEEIGFREAGPFRTYPSGHPLEFTLVETDALYPEPGRATETIELDAGNRHLAVAGGLTSINPLADQLDGDDTDLTIHTLHDARKTSHSDENTDIAVYHGMLGASPVYARFDTGAARHRPEESLRYGDFGDYRTVQPADETILRVDPANPSHRSPLDFPLPLGDFAGGAALVVLSGLHDAEGDILDPAAVVVEPDGETTVVD